MRWEAKEFNRAHVEEHGGLSEGVWRGKAGGEGKRQGSGGMAAWGNEGGGVCIHNGETHLDISTSGAANLSLCYSPSTSPLVLIPICLQAQGASTHLRSPNIARARRPWNWFRFHQGPFVRRLGHGSEPALPHLVCSLSNRLLLVLLLLRLPHTAVDLHLLFCTARTN